MNKKHAVRLRSLGLAVVLTLVASLGAASVHTVPALAAGPNLLANPDMEGGTTGWSVFGAGTLASNTSVVHGGTRSLAYTGRTASWNGPTQSTTSMLQNGASFTTILWMRTQSGSPTAKVTLQITANGTTNYVTLATGVVNSSTWTQLTGTVTVSWTGTLSSARLYVETTAGTDSFYIDDASFVNNTTPDPGPGPWPPSSTFSNPVAWQDFADIDIIRVGNVYYYSASTMHYSPGAPILRSYDLVNWEFAGHSVPRLDFGSKYDLSGARGYVRGIWASTLNYRPGNSTFYWMGCIDFSQTYVYTATAVEGPWQRRSQINNCYFDAGLLVDDNDTMYVAYGNTNISVAQLSADGLSQVRTQQVFSTPSSIGTLEGARFYKRNGSYYIFLTRPANGQYILKASNPWGPYEVRQVLLNLPGPVSGGGVPHQGGLVQTQNGAWYYMSFIDSYPGGRIPALAPITWTSDGWPQLQTVNGAWGTSYPYPNVPRPPRAVKPLTGTDTFTGTTLGPQWEWNHNPDNNRWSINNGLRLQTATVTGDLYSARNTLTHRIQGPSSTATIELDYSTMRDGDRAGLAMLRDSSAWIGIKRDNGTTRVVMTNGLTMDASWNTTGTGTEAAGANVSGGRIWLRANADIRPGAGRQARFSYSTNGVNFTALGPGFTLNNAWQFFMGYRYGIFNYATTSLGGTVTINRFDLTTP